MPGNSNQDRIHRLEEAFMLFAAIIAGQPEDATDDEKSAAQRRFAELMEEIRSQHV